MVAIFPKLCFWRRSLYSNLGDIDPEKLYRATLSSLKLSKSSADSHVAEIRAEMASAEIKARQIEMEEERREKKFAKQLEIKHNIEQARNGAERIEFEATQRRKTQETKDEAHSLRQKPKTLRRYETLFITMTLNLYPIVSVILMMIR